MTLAWQRTPAEAWEELVKREAEAIETELLQFADGVTDQIAAWMRANHRWENVTGAAEAGLYADVLHDVGRMVRILISHGLTISYAEALEANPRTALLGDTVDEWMPVIFRGVQDILRKHGGK